MKSSDKKIGKMLFVLAFVQVIIGTFQLILSFAYNPDIKIVILGVLMYAVLVIFIVYFSNKILKDN